MDTALAARPTGRERHFQADEIIVSKTDLKGKITYANRVFLRVSGYTEAETLGKPHNFIRHPDMPRGVFKLLWDRLQSGQEVFAPVINSCKGGDHYWVLAHVTPTFSPTGEILGYHSSRRVLPERLRKVIVPLYRQMVEVERSYSNSRQSSEAGLQFLISLLAERGTSYDEFIFAQLKEAA